MVAPIALYPDMLIAQILAASTYPTQVVEADRFMKQNPSLTGDGLAAQVNPQPWDPSVKSLCQFPSVLNTMSESLAWTTALGEAYYNQPQDVMNALQVMRKRAMDAGTLKSTSQQKVEVQTVSSTSAAVEGVEQPAQTQPAQQQVIVIQPAQPNTVYVPTYNPSTVYGAPVEQPPGYNAPTGYSGTEMLVAGALSFGAGVLLGSLINNGNNNWGYNWGGGNVYYNRNVWVSNSNFVRGPYGYRGYGPGYPGYRPGYLVTLDIGLVTLAIQEIAPAIPVTPEIGQATRVTPETGPATPVVDPVIPAHSRLIGLTSPPTIPI